MRKGLYIDDDEVRQVDQYQSNNYLKKNLILIDKKENSRKNLMLCSLEQPQRKICLFNPKI